MPELSIGDWLLLSGLVFFAGIVDSLAGGGGLITLPAYLSIGLPPALVLGTNKLASSIGTLAASLRYRRRVGFRWRDFWPAIACALIGSFFGARLAAYFDPRWLRWLILGIIPLAALPVLFPRLFGRESGPRLDFRALHVRSSLCALSIGSYDGFFG
ncbi:MAG: TSUP family transporter, partial [Elusimicrobia bacterium]|nr:TSUP family transporter [Elusimicrobiota bacterium]